MAENQRLNGVEYDFSQIEFNLKGKRYLDVSEISYSHSLEPAKKRGTDVRILGMTRGQYDTEGSMTMGKETYYEVIDALGDGYMEQSIDSITVTYGNDGERLKVDELVGVRIGEDSDEHSEGNDTLSVSVTLHITEIIRNGKRAYKVNDSSGASAGEVSL